MTKAKTRRTKEDLLEEGLSLVSSRGPESLTIDALCRELGVTKGSFYHHFQNCDAYVAELLDFWLERFGRALIEQSVRETAPEERLRRIVETAFRHPSDLDVAIRAWGGRDPAVRDHVRRMDAMRLENLAGAMRPYAASVAEAWKKARACYAAHLGAKVFCPSFDEALYLELVETMCDALNLPLFMRGDCGGRDT